MENYFAKNLKYLRERKNIKQGVMAEDLGVKQPTLSCWESGEREPDLDMIAKIAKYLNVYENIVTTDLTTPKNDNIDEIEILYSKYKDYISKKDKNIIKAIIEETKKEIDNKNK